jgi:hypothetical protein
MTAQVQLDAACVHSYSIHPHLDFVSFQQQDGHVQVNAWIARRRSPYLFARLTMPCHGLRIRPCSEVAIGADICKPMRII